MMTFRHVYGITLGELLLKHADKNTAAQAVVHHRRAVSGVDEFGGSTEIRGNLINSGSMARKVEAIDVGGYLEGKTDIPETERSSIIRHSLMPMIPSEFSICHTNLGTIISYLGDD